MIDWYMGGDREGRYEMDSYEGTFLAETFPDRGEKHEGAVLFLPEDWDEGDEIWLPKSQVVMDIDERRRPQRGDAIVIEIPMWLAEEKELI